MGHYDAKEKPQLITEELISFMQPRMARASVEIPNYTSSVWRSYPYRKNFTAMSNAYMALKHMVAYDEYDAVAVLLELQNYQRALDAIQDQRVRSREWGYMSGIERASIGDAYFKDSKQIKEWLIELHALVDQTKLARLKREWPALESELEAFRLALGQGNYLMPQFERQMGVLPLSRQIIMFHDDTADKLRRANQKLMRAYDDLLDDLKNGCRHDLERSIVVLDDFCANLDAVRERHVRRLKLLAGDNSQETKTYLHYTDVTEQIKLLVKHLKEVQKTQPSTIVPVRTKFCAWVKTALRAPKTS